MADLNLAKKKFEEFSTQNNICLAMTCRCIRDLN